MGFGRSIPTAMEGKIITTWGARAIYTGQAIDLLYDRQQVEAPAFEEDDPERKPAIDRLVKWVNTKGLPFLRRQAPKLYPDEDRVVFMDDGAFHIEASPQSSYGYLYIRAWEAI